jgi:hypothetical protein
VLVIKEFEHNPSVNSLDPAAPQPGGTGIAAKSYFSYV